MLKTQPKKALRKKIINGEVYDILSKVKVGNVYIIVSTNYDRVDLQIVPCKKRISRKVSESENNIKKLLVQ